MADYDEEKLLLLFIFKNSPIMIKNTLVKVIFMFNIQLSDESQIEATV